MNSDAFPEWLTGTLITTPIQHGPDKALKLELYMPRHGNVRVTGRGLDSDRTPMSDLKGKAAEPVIALADAMPAAEPLAHESRIPEILGPTPLYRTTCTLAIPSVLLPAWAFFQLEVAETADSSASKSPEDRIILEIPKRALSKIDKPALFWLLTRKQANDRIESIARKHGLFNRDDDATNDALVKLVFDILSGVDSPLLTESLEDDNDE